MKKIFFVLVLLSLIGFGIVFLIRKEEKPVQTGKKLSVVTTLFPLFDIATYVGGDYAEVTLLLPPGVEAHNFEPKPSDIVKVSDADVFIFTGKFMEPWVTDILKGLTNTKILVIDASVGTHMIPAEFHDGKEPSDAPDPHIWLDFENDIIIANAIADAFTQRSPLHSSVFQENARAYTEVLARLDAKYRTTLTSCRNKNLVFGGHYAFGYLAKRFNLTYSAAQGMSPDAEPTAHDLVSLVGQIKKNNVDTIYFEELSSPKIAETLAKETNTKLLLLNAGHNISKKDFENHTSFFAIMEENLINLRSGLHCD